MKYQLLEDHQVRLSDTILKAGIYTLEDLREAHKDGSFEFCLKYTKLGSKLIPYVEENQIEETKIKITKIAKKNV